MLGFNWVDLIILLILAAAIYNGIRIGFISQLFGFIGFFAAIFLAGWILPHILAIDNRTVMVVINANLVLLAGVLVGIRSYEFGEKLHISLEDKVKLHIVESVAGLILSLASTLIIVWLIAAGIGALPFAGLSNSVTDSFIIQKMNSNLPAAPDVFEDLTRYVDLNAPVAVYSKLAPNSSIGIAPIPSSIPVAVKADDSRVVRITSFGCGGIVDGSGFVAAKNIIATNAHVIAGIDRPIVKVGNSSYAATPILFDPNQDLALLRVNGLATPPLSISQNLTLPGADVYFEGYPNSIFTISPGYITNINSTTGPNIYGLGNITRSTYTIFAKIDNGSSGGPLLSSSGTVIGIAFARNTKDTSISYAMTPQILIKDIEKSVNTTKRVGIGSCYE